MKSFSLFFTAALLVFVGAGCAAAPLAADAPDLSSDKSAVASSRLDLSGSGLKEVPSYVFERTELTELDLSSNAISGAIQAEIRHLQNLQVLDLSGNEMTGVPAEIGQLSALRKLDLSENALTGLPLELGNLSNLQLLDLRGNNIAKADLDAIRLQLKETEILE